MHLSTLNSSDDLLTASEHGRICALAAAGQRDLQRCAAAHPDLFPPRPFDPTLFSTVSMATAFGAPWCDAEQLRVANQTALWIFAVDWLIDSQATSRSEVDWIVTSCVGVGRGAAPSSGDPLTGFLAEIRGRVVAAPAFAEHGPRWQDELRRMLEAMAREWAWKTARASGGPDDGPSFADYLDNADNFGSTLVNISHWILLGETETLANLPELMVASREVQTVLRLVNDLATYRRDVGWGDLNALMLASDREAVTDEIHQRMRRCQELLDPLADRVGREVTYLNRQIGFSTGFYQLTDFWGQR